MTQQKTRKTKVRDEDDMEVQSLKSNKSMPHPPVFNKPDCESDPEGEEPESQSDPEGEEPESQSDPEGEEPESQSDPEEEEPGGRAALCLTQRVTAEEENLQKVLLKHRMSVRGRSQHVSEGRETGSRVPLNGLFIQPLITEGQSDDISTLQEAGLLEAPPRREPRPPASIRCQDIFKAPPPLQGALRVVLTCGAAGAGKTFCVHKFCLDWAELVENQEVDLLLLFSFRELNLLRQRELSLLALIRVFHPALRELDARALGALRVLLVLDGLDQNRLPLEFGGGRAVREVTRSSGAGLLLTNLIRGDLLPSARVWITSRPAAAHRIPPGCVDRVTEVRGFGPAHQARYFRGRLGGEEPADRVLARVRASAGLGAMCRIPLFCWILVTVLPPEATPTATPTATPQLYAHFLLVLMERANRKCGAQVADARVLLRLGRLASRLQREGNFLFRREDLGRRGAELIRAALRSGLCTRILSSHGAIFRREELYCFLHRSLQEFLSDLHLLSGNPRVLQDLLGPAWNRSRPLVLRVLRDRPRPGDGSADGRESPLPVVNLRGTSPPLHQNHQDVAPL